MVLFVPSEMSIDPEFAKPEPGFDPTDNQVVLDYYPGGRMRAALDPKGQRAPTVQERINDVVGDFIRLIGRAPTEDERKRLNEIQLKCSGWLEGLKIDLEGKQDVPIKYFNRLVEEQEDTILFVVRDRVNFDAIYIHKVLEREDEIKRLVAELNEANDGLQDSKQLGQQLQDTVNDIDSKYQIAQLTIAELQDELEKLRVNTKDCPEVKAQNQKLKEQVSNLQDKITKLDNNKPRSREDELENTNRQIGVLDVQMHTIRAAKPVSGYTSMQDEKEATEQLESLELQLDLLHWQIFEEDDRKDEFNHLNKKSKDLGREVAQLKKEISICREDNITLRGQIENLKEQTEASKKDRDTLENMNNKLTEALQQELQDLKGQRADGSTELTHLKAQIKTLTEGHNNAEAPLEELKEIEDDGKEDELVAKFAGEEIKHLKEQVDSLKAEKATIEADAITRQRDLYEKCNAATNSVTTQQEELSTQEKVISNLKVDVKELTTKLDREITRHDAAVNDKQATLDAAIAKSHESATKFASRKEEVDQMLKEKEDELADLQKKLHDCQTETAGSSGTSTTSDGELRKQVSEKDKKLKHLQGELDVCNTHNKTTQDRIDELERKLLESDAGNVEAVQRKLEEYEVHRVANRQRINDLEMKLILRDEDNSKALEIGKIDDDELKDEKAEPCETTTEDNVERLNKEIEELRNTIATLEHEVKQGEKVERVYQEYKDNQRGELRPPPASAAEFSPRRAAREKDRKEKLDDLERLRAQCAGYVREWEEELMKSKTQSCCSTKCCGV